MTDIDTPLSTATAAPGARPAITLKPGEHKRVLSGHPWVFSNEVVMDPAAKALPPGTLVRLVNHNGRALGTAMFNPHPLISARLLTRDAAAVVDRGYLRDRIGRSLALRTRLYGAPFYRLIHAEADGLPGVIVDRYGDTLVLQINTAGMALLQPELVAALDEVLAPQAILLRNDSTSRTLEGLDSHVALAKGALPGPVEVLENGVRFLADVREGQKTGWFFDQRDNRAAVARLAAGSRLLDVYCYTGGFAIQAAVAGAAEVVAVDRSQPALDLAGRSAALNEVAGKCRFERGDAFSILETMAARNERFDFVIADPPAFVRSRKEINQAARAYRKLARLTAALVRPGGFLFIASCSHHMSRENFDEQVTRGLTDAGREGRYLRSSGAAADHPVHPHLPESAYLKALLAQLD